MASRRFAAPRLETSTERSRRTRERQRLGLTPARQPQTALGRIVWDLSRAEGVPMDTLTVMHPRHDPFRHDTGANHRDGKWFAEQIARLVPRGTVHLRGFHYVIVASADVRKPNGQTYRNTEADWVWLSEHASKAARWLGYVPFTRIVDERNAEPEVWEPAVSTEAWTDIDASSFIELPELASAVPLAYCSGLAGPQPYRIIFVGEKSSLGAVLRPLAEAVSGELILPNGEMSDTLIYNLAQRAAADGRLAVVLYFSDFDPAGYTMPVNVARKLQALTVEEFPGLEIEVHAVALTLDQVRQYDLPSTPLKETELRADRWREAMGHEQTEIDALAALRPEVLRDIAREAVEPFYDFGLNQRARQAETEWRQQAEVMLRDHPDYSSVCGEIEAALDQVTAAVERLRIPLPDVAMLEPEITTEAPLPLFTTDDDFVEATRRMVNYKKFNGIDD